MTDNSPVVEPNVTPTGADVLTVPEVRVPVWAWFCAAAAVVVMYFVMLENGAVLGQAAGTLHEFFHDGRHFVGVPCH